MLKYISPLLLLTVLAVPSLAQTRDDRVPVDVRVSNHSALNQDLQIALQKEIKNSSKLRLAERSDLEPIVIRNAYLQQESLDGRAVLLFEAHVSAGADNGFKRIGVCYKSQIGKCVRSIIDAVDRVAFWKRAG